MGSGQPGMQREHTGFDAEAQDHGEGYHQHQGFIACHGTHVQIAARQEGQGIGKPVQEEQTEQHHIRTEQGVEQVLQATLDGILGTIVENQRHRQQGHQFVEQVEGHQVAGEGQGMENAEDHHIETEEPFFLLLVLHILKGIEAGDEPNHVHHQSKELAQGIHTEI